MGLKAEWMAHMKLPVCSVAMTVDYNKNTQLHEIILRNGVKEIHFCRGYTQPYILCRENMNVLILIKSALSIASLFSFKKKNEGRGYTISLVFTDLFVQL